MEHTLALFQHLIKNLPPFFPGETKEKMEHALWHAQNDPTVRMEQLEDTMIKYGYLVWPWNRAYQEFYFGVESQLGDHFLAPRLSGALKQRYHDFVKYGGSLRELHSGRPAAFFSHEERTELYVKLLETQKELRTYTDRLLSSSDKEKYLGRVDEFVSFLDGIKTHLTSLKNLAQAEDDHPNLAAELMAQVRNFEHGLCLLAPEIDFDAVKNLEEHYRGRKKDLNRLRGIHLPFVVPQL